MKKRMTEQLKDGLQDGITKLLSVSDAAEILGQTPRTIHRLCREGRLGCVMVTAKRRMFMREQLTAYVDAQTIAPKNVIDRRLTTSLPLKAKGGEKPGERDQRVKRVSERMSVREEIRQLCQ